MTVSGKLTTNSDDMIAKVMLTTDEMVVFR